MSGSTHAASCANHPYRAADAACARCVKPICESCSLEFVATDQAFCSESCRDAAPVSPDHRPVDNATLAAGLEKPIRLGWGLWARSVGRIALHALPVAVVVGLLVGILNGLSDDLTAPAVGGTTILLLALVILVCAAFGIALVGIILSARHTNFVEAVPYRAASRRLVPWMVTWTLMMGITITGYFALIIPGIYLALRLFWADEFALVHDKNPVAALRASWELTREKAGIVFMFQFILGFAQYAVIIPVVIMLVFAFGGIEQLGLGVAGQLGITAFSVCFVGLVAYGAMHGPEIVQFYGMRATAVAAGAGAESAGGRRSGGMLFNALVFVGAAVGIGFVGLFFIPGFLDAVDLGRQKRTVNDSRAIAVAMESYAEVYDEYPQAADIAELQRTLVPDHIDVIPLVDGWKRQLRVVSTPTGYEIRSAGKDGLFDDGPYRGATFDADEDIVWSNGELVQWPERLFLE